MVCEGTDDHHVPISLLLSLGWPWFWFDQDASRPTGAGREEFQVKGNNAVMADGRSLVCKPRKTRQVRVTAREGKQGPGNQTRRLETQENGSKMEADMRSSSEKSPLSWWLRILATHDSPLGSALPFIIYQIVFQAIPVGLLFSYCSGDLPAKNKNGLIFYFLSLENTFFFSFPLSLCVYSLLFFELILFELDDDMFPEHFSDPLPLYLLFPILPPLLFSSFSSPLFLSFPSLYFLSLSTYVLGNLLKTQGFKYHPQT